MVAWHGPRSPAWLFERLDSEDRPLGALDGVTGGRCEIRALSRLGGTASLVLDDRNVGIDWQRDRVRVTYDPGIPGVQAWPVFTGLFTSPTVTHLGGGRTVYEVDLLTKMAVIDEDTVEATYSLPAGTPVIATVAGLIRSAGEDRIAVTPSDAVLGAALVWDAGTSKLTIVNDLLAVAGYWSLWCDGSGQYRVEPYLDPASRPVAHTFRHGATAFYAPEWSRTQDMSSVPNRFVVVGQGDEETEPLVGVATNENPDSPFSFQARGRWVTRTEEGVEGDSQQVFDQLAERRLLDAMGPVARLVLRHAVVPVDQNALVAFDPAEGAARLATVQSMSVDFRFDALVDAEWREVVAL